jgi:hypothetical protein
MSESIDDVLYRHPSRPGRWGLQSVTDEWVTLRSVDAPRGHTEQWMMVKERREHWPNDWTRA